MNGHPRPLRSGARTAPSRPPTGLERTSPLFPRTMTSVYENDPTPVPETTPACRTDANAYRRPRSPEPAPPRTTHLPPPRAPMRLPVQSPAGTNVAWGWGNETSVISQHCKVPGQEAGGRGGFCGVSRSAGMTRETTGQQRRKGVRRECARVRTFGNALCEVTHDALAMATSGAGD